MLAQLEQGETMTKDEALKLALEALEQLDGIDTETECVTIDVGDVIDAIEEALAQPQRTPVKDLEDIAINITWNENSMRDFGKDELNFARAILRKAQEK